MELGLKTALYTLSYDDGDGNGDGDDASTGEFILYKYVEDYTKR